MSDLAAHVVILYTLEEYKGINMAPLLCAVHYPIYTYPR